ncbi:hypothetical protein RVR_P1118 (plasmid) [Actinacidiphila reveromycinica]|uniref:Uncharacterized protein n=1 Tax=Actinacidiphila reveromycinica TaxID=659352 RepID=A0A7R6QCN5_9ACTN|nr:hypothetical protein RVR_P1118 [Streptomyces sp. SN-593]
MSCRTVSEPVSSPARRVTVDAAVARMRDHLGGGGVVGSDRSDRSVAMGLPIGRMISTPGVRMRVLDSKPV